MKEVKTKRGTVGFGKEKIILEESYMDYFRNLYRELWKEGEHHHMILVFLMVFALSYGLTMTVAALMLQPSNLMVFLLISAAVYVVIWIIQRSRGFTADRKIRYDEISKVNLVRGSKWLTCPRFVVAYGEGDRRYISMHSHLIPGVEERISEIKDGFNDNGIEVS
ncbi:MAG: hypothetical protein ABEK10_04680 [Candidatus Nanosalina sp.]